MIILYCKISLPLLIIIILICLDSVCIMEIPKILNDLVTSICTNCKSARYHLDAKYAKIVAVEMVKKIDSTQLAWREILTHMHTENSESQETHFYISITSELRSFLGFQSITSASVYFYSILLDYCAEG